MVKLRRRVLTRWREVSAESSKVQIELLLSSKLEPADAARALSASVNRVIGAFDATHADAPPGVDEPRAGEWDVLRVPEGAVLIGGYDSDAFEELLQAILEDHGRAGVRGTLDLYALPAPPSPPASIGVIEGHIRVLGRRVIDGVDRWAADRAALDRVLEAATSWCLEARPDRGITLRHGSQPALPLRRCESPYGRLREVMGDSGWTTLRSIGDDRFRSVTAAPNEGRVTIVEAGPIVHRAGWRPSVRAATQLLRLVSEDAVYGFVRRVSSLASTEFAWLSTDRLQSLSLVAAHEERFAPDAFAIQLLGPGYEARIPTRARWRKTELVAGRVLLEHIEPAPWFDELTLEEAVAGESVPRRAVIAAARADLAPILFADLTGQQHAQRHAWRVAHPYIRLSDEIVAQVRALRAPPFVDHWDVALVMRAGRVVEGVELGFAGSVVTMVADERDFTLDPNDIVSVLDRSPRGPSAPER